MLKKSKRLKKGFEEKKSVIHRNPNLINKRRSAVTKNNKESGIEKNDKNSEEPQITKITNVNDVEKNENNSEKTNEQSDGININPAANSIPEELENNKKPVSTDLSEKKSKKKGRDRKAKKSYDNTLDNIFGNGGIIVIAQSLPNFDDEVKIY